MISIFFQIKLVKLRNQEPELQLKRKLQRLRLDVLTYQSQYLPPFIAFPNVSIFKNQIEQRQRNVANFFFHLTWQAKAAAVEEEDDEGISDLRARIAAYNFDSSPDRSEGKLKDIR